MTDIVSEKAGWHFWVDRGGTRGYESPRATAGRLIKRAGSSTERLIKAFAAVDDAVLIQAMTLLDEAKADLLADLCDERADSSEYFDLYWSQI